jgi:hypothetical protein
VRNPRRGRHARCRYPYQNLLYGLLLIPKSANAPQIGSPFFGTHKIQVPEFEK